MNVKKILIFLLVALTFACSTKGVDPDSYKVKEILSSSLSVEDKAEAILSLMTLEEKMLYIHGSEFKAHGKVERLGLQEVFYQDSTMGVTSDGTGFPATLLAVASWDKELMRKFGATVGEEALAKGYKVLLGPGVNIYRAPTCGRNFEYCGEDPYLAKVMSSEYIIGAEDTGVITTVKHFIANNQDADRHGTSSDVSERALREIYLPSFKSAVKAGVSTFMTSYNPLNGFPTTENRWLLTKVLRDEWGFDGFIMSDWWCTYSTEGPFVSGLDLEMPSDSWVYRLENLQTLYKSGRIPKDEFVKILDEKVLRILKVYIRKNVYTTPRFNPGAKARCPEHDKISEDIAKSSIVLLKNKNSILPIDKNKKQNIVITGSHSFSLNTTSFGACTVLSNRDGKLFSVDPMVAFREYIDNDTNISRVPATCYNNFSKADKVIYFAGFGAFTEGEAHDRAWDLPATKVKEIKNIAKYTDNLIVVLNVGNSVETESWIDDVEGLLYVSFPGHRGDYAIASILFGDTNPSGKLPFTMAKKWEDLSAPYAQKNNPNLLVTWGRFEKSKYKKLPLAGKGKGKALGGAPSILKSSKLDEFENSVTAYDKMDHMVYAEDIYVGYRHFDTNNIKPQFPFGFGLSYTKFEMSKLKIQRYRNMENCFTVSINVKNVGDVAGAEVIQLYINDEKSELDRPEKELKGFTKVYLRPNEEKTVSLKLSCDDFSYFNDKKGEWVLEKGKFNILVGNSSKNILLSDSITL